MSVYRGKLSLAIGVAIDVIDIDPPERSGYINEIVNIEVIAGEPTAGNWSQFMGVASVKVPKRATFSEADMYEPDVIMRCIPYTYHFSDQNDFREIQLVLDDDAYFQDSVRLILSTRDGAVAGADAEMFYRITVEEKKLTDSIRQLLNERSYS